MKAFLTVSVVYVEIHVQLYTLEASNNFIFQDSSRYERSNPIWLRIWLQTFSLVGVFVAYRHTLSDVNSCQIINSAVQRRGENRGIRPTGHVKNSDKALLLYLDKNTFLVFSLESQKKILSNETEGWCTLWSTYTGHPYQSREAPRGVWKDILYKFIWLGILL